ncbi:hypothetical protein [Paraburkholderia sp. BL10I2N1]|uniref:hypothetical protein n=1 Tax=Paraburkholderia sp. BL10I2N1 TaxID=1938796 RepID=UPI0010600EF4|nr:hypothetical protein [Paraburkholderia sp. BL10I2N1]TDN70023.1 hypothetical protein B0G77_3470 [Paraburkholderia sp. BL10I2N1]
MKITDEWIRANATRNGGYTKKQLELLDVNWPPIVGWKGEISGREIDDALADQFEAIARATFNDGR